MADQNPKPNLFGNLGGGANAGGTSSPFSFGNSTGTPPSTGGGSSLFGNNAASGSSLFGSAAKKPEEGSKPATSLFGNLQTPSKPSTSAAESLSTPANSSSAPGNPSTTPIFSPPAPSGNIFGQKPSTTNPQPMSSSAAPPSLFGATSSNTPKTTTSLFGQVSSNNSGGGSGLFGQGSSQSQNKDQPPTSLFGAAPTPSAGNEASKPSLFGTPAATGATGEQSTKPSLFGTPAATGPGVGLSSKPSLFGGAAPAAAAASTTTTTASSTLSFGTTAPAKPLFGAPASSSSSQPSQPAASTTAPSSLFGSLASNAQKPDATTSSTPAGTAGAAAAPSSAAPTSLFGAPAATSQTQTSQTSSAQAPGAAAQPLFGSIGKPAAAAPVTQPAPSQAPTTAPQASGNDSTATAGAPTTAASGAGSGAAIAFGTSTAGPAPTPQSRLKNKTMDDIITRWATDLKKYQKEFQTQAEKVAQWDRLLVENSNAITKLYSRTFQAERDTAEVQKQLSVVEDNQSELSQWLDRYEQEVESLMAKEGMGQREGLQGPDQERERTYKAAERVQEKLSDMGNELTGLIEEINAVSNTLSNSSKPDDPLSQIVRILNNHLSQLQQIDQDTAALQAKVAAAKAESQRLGYRSNGVNSAADDFYRSIRSGR